MASQKNGFSLIELMVGVAILGTIGMAISSMTTSAFKATNSSKIRLDIQDIKRKITTTLSCQSTFAAYGAARPIPCATGTAITMKNSTGGNLVPPSGKIAGWNIDARCEVLGGANGLSIYATKKKPGGGFFKDPLNETMLLDESSPVSLIFAPAARPCDGFFSSTVGAVTCPAGQIVSGVDFQSDSFTCTPVANILPVCGAGTVLKNVGGSIQCVKSGLDMTDCVDVTDNGAGPTFISIASCPANYSIVGGYGNCLGGGALQAFTQNSGVMGNGWTADCWRGDLGGDAPSVAVARCCRFY